MLNKPIKTSLTHHGSYGGCVTARFENIDEAVCFVTFAVVGSDFVITSFGVNPHATAAQAQQAGDEIDRVLEREAGPLGITRLLIVHPHQDTAEVVRTYQVQPWCISSTQSKAALYIN